MTPRQRAEFHQALLSAFRDYADLQMMVAFGLDWNLQEIVAAGPLTTVAFKVIEEAEARGSASALVVAARDARPGNPLIVQFVEKYPQLIAPSAAPASPPPGQTPPTTLPRVKLIDLLILLPITSDFQGRDSLLQGIPGSAAFNRDGGNKRGDLTQIVDQVLALGPLSSGVNPVITLIDNALPFAAEGAATYTELHAIRASLSAPAPGN